MKYEKPVLREMALPVEQKSVVYQLECLYGPHKAELLHRGTSYCRRCYDERNPYGKLIDN